MPPGPSGQNRRNIHFEAFGFSIDHSDPVRGARNADLGTIDLKAVADAWGQSAGDFGGDDDYYAVRLRGGTLAAFDKTDPWDRLGGWLLDDGQTRTFRDFIARRGDAKITLNGEVPHDSKQLPTLVLVGEDPQIERLLKQIVPLPFAGMCSGFGLSGAGNLKATLGLVKNEPEINLHVTAAQMKPAALPLMLRNVSHHISINAAGFSINGFFAQAAADASISGAARGKFVGESVRADANLKASNLMVDDALVAALPGNMRSLIDGLQLRGPVDIDLRRANISSDTETPRRFEGRVDIHGGSMNIGLPLTDFHGYVEGTCEVDPHLGVALSATLTIESGNLDGRPVHGVTARLERTRGEPLLRMEQIDGEFCEGRIDGAADFDMTTRKFHLTLKFADAAFNTFRGANPEADSPMRRGRMDGTLFLTGVGADRTRRAGGGRIRVRGTTLLSNPVTREVLEASRGRSHSLSEDVEQAEMSFTWDGVMIHFSRVEILSPSTRLIGSGRWNDRDDQIDMTMVSAPPANALRLPGISDLFETAGQELFQYRIEGKASKPRVRVETLRNLTEPLRQLIRGQ